MTKVSEGFTPQNTTENTDWALGVFQEWQKQRDDDQCPSDLLQCPSAEKLNYWLSCSVVECRQVDGQPSSSTLYQLLAGLLRFSRSKSEDMFAALNSCPINISPQTMVINIQQPNTTVNMDTK